MALFGKRKENSAQTGDHTVQTPSNTSKPSHDREQQEYYRRNTLKIPVGCRACGGPYPSCKDSCPAFDD